jgi:hypothetical protein
MALVLFGGLRRLPGKPCGKLCRLSSPGGRYKLLVFERLDNDLHRVANLDLPSDVES